MNFNAHPKHTLRSNRHPTGQFWSRTGAVTALMLRRAFLEQASHTVMKRIKDEKTNKTEERLVMVHRPRVDDARKYCSELFGIYADLCGMKKSQVVHAFLTENMHAMYNVYRRQTKQPDIQYDFFVSTMQDYWQDACNCMRHWKPDASAMLHHMDARYKEVARVMPISPERANKERQKAYRDAKYREREASHRKIEEAIKYAYDPQREVERRMAAEAQI